MSRYRILSPGLCSKLSFSSEVYDLVPVVHPWIFHVDCPKFDPPKRKDYDQSLYAERGALSVGTHPFANFDLTALFFFIYRRYFQQFFTIL